MRDINPETHYAEELLRQEQTEDENEHYQELLKERVDELTGDGGEYQPFGVRNIAEAMGEFTEQQFFELAVVLGANYYGTENPVLQKLAVKTITEFVVSYWKKQAMAEAERILSHG